MEITKVVIPTAGMGTRFFPLSRVVPKEFFPLADKPILQYIIEEVKKSGIKEVVFVIGPGQKTALNYFQRFPKLEAFLVKRKKEKIIKELRDFEEIFEGIKFSFVLQTKPMGDGHAILQAAKKINGEAVATAFGDDVFDTEEPAISQLINIYNTSKVPVLSLKKMPADKIPAYGTVAVEKIANNLYKIKKIIEKPEPSEIKSDLVVAGRHILTPEVFQYLKKAKPSKKGEIILAEVLDRMLTDGKVIYGYEIKGEWLECGDKLKWLKSFFYITLKDPRYRDELKQYLKSLR